MAVYSLVLFEWAQIMADVVEIVVVFHNLILFFYHILSLRKLNKNKGFLERLSLLPILLYIFQGITCVQITFDLRPQFMSCKYFTDFASIVYVAAKTSLYALFLERLFMIFNTNLSSKVYQFKKHFIYVSRVVLVSYLLMVSAFLLSFSAGYYIPERNHCTMSVPMWVIAVIAFGDIIFSITITIVFCRRLLLLMMASNENAKIADVMMKNNELSDIMGKLSLLAMIATFTTCVVLLIVAIFELGSFWTALDAMVNCWCIMLMFNVHNKLYTLICRKRRISNTCLACLSCTCCCDIRPQQLSESVPKTSKNKENNDTP